MCIGMNRKQFIYAVVISVIVGGIFTLGQSMVFGGGATYFYDSDYKNIEDMKYSEAQEYLIRRSKKISGFESFKNGVRYLRFWKYFAHVWLYYTVMGFICCLLYAVTDNQKNGRH